MAWLATMAAMALAGACGPSAPSPSPSPTPVFADTVRQSLLGLTGVNGDVSGSLIQGSVTRTLVGKIAIDGSDTQIALVALGDGGQISFEETIAAGERYVRKDAGPWVDHGAAASSFDLLALLRTVDTSLDQGRAVLDGHRLHLISQNEDALVLAAALGFETNGWAGESGALRLWADNTGTMIAFGASIAWNAPVGGTRSECRLELDVLLGSTAAPAIAAPTGSWRWVVDMDMGISLGVPATWARAAQPSNGFILYQFSGGSLSYGRIEASGSLEDQAGSILGKSTPDSQSDCVIAGEPALCTVVRSPDGSLYIALDLVGNSSHVYVILIQGTSGSEAELALSQILTTVELDGR